VFSATQTLVQVESPDTRSLLDRARAGDSEAFGELCVEHEGRLLRQAMTLCGDAAMAEDLAQEALVEAWRGLGRYNGRCQFFTWLCAILLNRFRNALRARRPLPAGVEAGEREHEAPAPDEAVVASERAALVRRRLAELPEKHRQVIFLRFYVDDSLPEIAAAVGCSVGTVKSRLFHAMEKLRRMNLDR